MSIYAQEANNEPAEVIGSIDVSDNRIPPIQVTNYTKIPIKVKDAFGIPWGNLSTNLPILSRYVWPIIHPSWKPLLGFSQLRFETEVVEGDPRGWYHRVNPSSIAEADSGRSYDLLLEVKTDDIAVDYAVVIGIKATRLTGDGQELGVSYIYVPVKASSLNNIKMTAQEFSKEIGPYTYTTFHADISNYGYYRDMFQLEFETDDDLRVMSPNKVIVLDAGETKQVSIDVLTPDKTFDIGTPYEIHVYAKSSSDPNQVHVASLRVISKGMYISPLIFIIATPIIIIIVLFFIFFIYLKDKRDREQFGKPNKPWTIPAEKKYLQELKEKDSKKYEEALKMMHDEYQSSLDWYQSNKQYELGKDGFDNGTIVGKILNLIPLPSKKSEKEVVEQKPVEDKKPKKKVEKKAEKQPEKQPEEVKEEPSEKETISIKKSFSKGLNFFKKDKEDSSEQEKSEKIIQDESKIQEEVDESEEISDVDIEKERAELKKQKTLLKIKRAQERQKRKLSKL